MAELASFIIASPERNVCNVGHMAEHCGWVIRLARYVITVMFVHYLWPSL
jgi:hypothetical protein